MLVLTRHDGQRIILTWPGSDEQIVISVRRRLHRGRPGGMRVAIEAPPRFKILREEIVGREAAPCRE